MSLDAHRHACRNCGEGFVAFPPDDEHNQCSIENYGISGTLAQNYDCKNCEHRNVLFWYWRDPNT
jgi:hypothetical protein